MAEDEGRETTETTDDDEEEETEETLDDLRAERDRLRASLKKANAEAKKRRLEAREREQETKNQGEGGDIDAKIKAAAAEASKATAGEWARKVLRVEAKAALATAGAVSPDRAVRLLPLEDLDVDDDGTVSGLDEAIKELRDEMPQVFGRRQSGDHKSKGDGPSRKAETASERLAARLQGRS